MFSTPVPVNAYCLGLKTNLLLKKEKVSSRWLDCQLVLEIYPFFYKCISVLPCKWQLVGFLGTITVKQCRFPPCQILSLVFSSLHLTQWASRGVVITVDHCFMHYLQRKKAEATSHYLQLFHWLLPSWSECCCRLHFINSVQIFFSLCTLIAWFIQLNEPSQLDWTFARWRSVYTEYLFKK